MDITSTIGYVGFQFCSSLKHDDESVRHGHFVVEALGDDRCGIRLSHATWLALQIEERMADFGSHAMAQAPGEYLIPMSVMRAGDASDLIRSLELIDPEPSATCIYPPCLLPTVTTRDGYPLCSEHLALMQGWDDLVAAF